MSRIVVAGGSGVLGVLVGREVGRRRPDWKLVVGDHRPDRGAATAKLLDAETTTLDATDPASVRTAITGADAVIVALGQREPLVQDVCLELGVPCVDVTASGAMTTAVAALDERARAAAVASVSMAGLFPGLSGLLAVKTASRLDEVDHVDVSLLQNTNANVGRSGVVDMLGIISSPVESRGHTEPGFRLRSPETRRLRLIDHAERRALAVEADLARTSYWTGWNSAPFTALVATMVRVGALPALAPRLAGFVRHDPSRPEEVRLSVRAHGTRSGADTRVRLGLTAESDYGATAAVAVALADLTLGGGLKGAGTPLSFTTFDALVARMGPNTVTVWDED
ncbi:saccharopine dehydrogenase NADP-binding domain-containing protein [Spiractinospora alimapuensis]|uniref:saccharopine dehydrogenase NADP-binding domain-containing protein n=1 Tax=Spiractinospora alimapuensis TaxID=2820884 RepID=UPI001F445FEC|nr:saccharopine dehydrogenase NADP-binding domain-containing protein [Spiractinospora alimapuensis]QVQ53468.1 saccharopine dehydrogenase NADP-binding domain-containing protein [Spiractinospora alimapuensis]